MEKMIIQILTKNEINTIPDPDLILNVKPGTNGDYIVTLKDVKISTEDAAGLMGDYLKASTQGSIDINDMDTTSSLVPQDMRVTEEINKVESSDEDVKAAVDSISELENSSEQMSLGIETMTTLDNTTIGDEMSNLANEMTDVRKNKPQKISDFFTQAQWKKLSKDNKELIKAKFKNGEFNDTLRDATLKVINEAEVIEPVAIEPTIKAPEVKITYDTPKSSTPPLDPSSLRIGTVEPGLPVDVPTIPGLD